MIPKFIKDERAERIVVLVINRPKLLPRPDQALQFNLSRNCQAENMIILQQTRMRH